MLHSHLYRPCNRVAGTVAALDGDRVDTSRTVAGALGSQIERESTRDLPIGGGVAITGTVLRFDAGYGDDSRRRCRVDAIGNLGRQPDKNHLMVRRLADVKIQSLVQPESDLEMLSNSNRLTHACLI